MKRNKKKLKPLAGGAALLLALSGWLPGMVWAADAAGSQDDKEQKTVAEQNGKVPLVEVEVKDKKEKKRVETKEGTAQSGYRSTTANLGPLGKTSLQDTPFSFQVVSDDFIKNTQAQSSSYALRYNPTVQAKLGSNLSSDYFMIRGFTNSPGTSSGSAVNGLRVSVFNEPMEDKERIEVMNGATGFLYGFSSPGGVINYVLKKPTDKPLADVTIGDAGGNQFYIHGDFGGPVDKDGKLKYRLNLADTGKGNVGIEHESHKRFLASGVLEWQPNPNTVWSFDASHYEREISWQQGIFLIGNATVIPDAPDLSRNYGAPYNFTRDSYTRYGTELTAKLNDVFSLRAALRYTATDNVSLNMRDSWINNNGDYTSQMQCKGTNQVITTQGYALMDAVFDKTPIKQKLSFGWISSNAQSKTAYPNGATATYYFPTSMVANMWNPLFPADPHYSLAIGDPLRTTERTNVQSVLLSDQITFNEKWSMLLGGNYSVLDDKTWNANTGAAGSSYHQSKLTPGVALMFKPTPRVMTYLSYIQGLQVGDAIPQTYNGVNVANYPGALAPYVTTQLELGAKTTIGATDLNVALFRIDKASSYFDAGSRNYTQDGQEVHTGAEVTFNGKVTPNVTLGGGFSILDAKIKKTNTAAILNNSPLGVPDKMARLYAEYTLPKFPALTLTAGLSYTGRVWVDNANTLALPSVFLVDCGARYQTKFNGHDVIMRLTINNVTGKNYWTSKGDTMVYPGNPRTVLFTTEYKF